MKDKILFIELCLILIIDKETGHMTKLISGQLVDLFLTFFNRIRSSICLSYVINTLFRLNKTVPFQIY